MRWIASTFGGIVVLGIAWTIRCAATGDSLQAVMTAIMTAAFCSIYLFAVRPFVIVDTRLQRLRQRGSKVQAVLESVTATGKTVNGFRVMHVRVAYHYGGLTEVLSQVEQPVAPHDMHRLVAGRRIPLLVDPDRPEKFVLDL